MRKYLIEKLKALRQLFVSKSVCDRCNGSGDLLLVGGFIEDCPRCGGSGKQTVC